MNCPYSLDCRRFPCPNVERKEGERPRCFSLTPPSTKGESFPVPSGQLDLFSMAGLAVDPAIPFIIPKLPNNAKIAIVRRDSWQDELIVQCLRNGVGIQERITYVEEYHEKDSLLTLGYTIILPAIHVTHLKATVKEAKEKARSTKAKLLITLSATLDF